jgi:hypothetical protein
VLNKTFQEALQCQDVDAERAVVEDLFQKGERWWILFVMPMVVLFGTSQFQEVQLKQPVRDVGWFFP